jgi:hypothetical protein
MSAAPKFLLPSARAVAADRRYDVDAGADGSAATHVSREVVMARTSTRGFGGARIVVATAAAVCSVATSMSSAVRADDAAIPNLIGSWVGENRTVSDKKGYKIWGEKTVEITEQQDRRFRGHFTYPEGTKNFFGVIYPDNVSFTWVASDSKGYNHGRILGPDKIAACYVESGADATAGCAELTRKK